MNMMTLNLTMILTKTLMATETTRGVMFLASGAAYRAYELHLGWTGLGVIHLNHAAQMRCLQAQRTE